MTALPRILCACVGVTGVVGAVGTPITLHSMDISRKRRSLAGLYQISITHCSTDSKNSLQEVNYGATGLKEVCWDLEQEGQGKSLREEYSGLFSQEWDQGIKKKREK